MPMLGEKHPDMYPRFRDCFLVDEGHPEYDDNFIHVYTRVGGGNRGAGYGEEELKQHPNYVADFDDSFDSTYATYVFSVPDEWKADYDEYRANGPVGFSSEYKKRIRAVFPKLNDVFNQLWDENVSAPEGVEQVPVPAKEETAS